MVNHGKNRGLGGPKKLTDAEREARQTTHEWVGAHKRARCNACGLHRGYPIHSNRRDYT